MKKIKMILIILMFISIILTPCNFLAAGMNLDYSICFIDENGYDDGKLDVSHYAPKCTLTREDEDGKYVFKDKKLNYTTSGDKRIGSANVIQGYVSKIDTEMNVQMRVEPVNDWDKIYVGDTLTVTFYFIDGAGHMNLSTARVGKDEKEYENDRYRVELEQSKIETGNPHLMVKAKIIVKSKGSIDVPIKLILSKDSDHMKSYNFNAQVNIKIPYVRDPYDDYHNMLISNGYKLVTGMEGSYGVVSRTKNQMIRQGIVSEEKINSSGINFKQYYDDENKKKDGLTNWEGTFHNISFNQEKKVLAWQMAGKSPYTNADGETTLQADMAWDDYRMKAGKKYMVTYEFVYFERNDALYYKLVIDKEGETTNHDGDSEVRDRLNEGLEEVIEEAEKAKKRLLAKIPQDEQRNTVVFQDVLEDIDYYTNVGELDPDSSAKAEEKIGTVVKVITNIGIILSILMPAILGIKYMLGSVEEKADYKKDMIPYLVGAVLLFGVCTVVKILQSVGNSINNI